MTLYICANLADFDSTPVIVTISPDEDSPLGVIDIPASIVIVDDAVNEKSNRTSVCSPIETRQQCESTFCRSYTSIS